MKYMLMGVVALMGIGAADVASARGAKPVVAVAEFKNESGAGWWSGGVGWELSGMLSNELVATNSFAVVERDKLENVLEEQNLAASGRVAGGTGAKIGKLVGADYLIAGTVTAYEEGAQSTGGGFGFKGISLGGNSSKAYLAIDLRVINATTGAVEYVRTIEGNAKSGGMSVGLSKGYFSGALGQQKNTPAGKAIRAALVEATDYLSCVMVDQNGCEADYQAKDSARRAKTRSAIDLDD